jgi:hypothetical protein
MNMSDDPKSPSLSLRERAEEREHRRLMAELRLKLLVVFALMLAGAFLILFPVYLMVYLEYRDHTLVAIFLFSGTFLLLVATSAALRRSTSRLRAKGRKSTPSRYFDELNK